MYKWYKSIDGQHRFSTEALNYLTAYKQTVDNDLIACLVLDEMAIRQKIEFMDGKLYGTVNVSEAFACNEQNMAKEILVFLLVSINQSWKLPIGYFLIDRMSGVRKSNLVLQSLRLLHETGVNVVCITCNDASTNLSMARTLGCNLDVHYLQPYFSHPVSNKRVHFLQDPDHMIKLVWNTLGDYGCIKNQSSGKIKWDYIIELKNLQEE